MPNQKKYTHSKTVRSVTEESLGSETTLRQEESYEVTEEGANEASVNKKWKSCEDLSNIFLNVNLDRYFSAISLSGDDSRNDIETSYWSTTSFIEPTFFRLPHFMDPNVGLLNHLPSLCSSTSVEISGHWATEPSVLDDVPRGTHLQSSRDPVIVLIGGIDPMNPTDYVVGGALLRYHCGKHIWQLCDMMPEPRNYHAAVLVKNVIYITGGNSPFHRCCGQMIASATTFCLDVDTSTWHYCADMIEGRAYHAMAALHGTLFVFGGRGSNGRILSSVERYIPEENTWCLITRLPEPRMGLVATVYQNSLWIFGGFTMSDNSQQGCLLQTVYSFNPNTEDWELQEPLPEPVAFSAATTIENEVWIFGGATLLKHRSGPHLLSTGVVYVFSHGEWEKPTRLLLPRHSLALAKLGSSVILMGGMTTSSNEATKLVSTVDSFSAVISEEVSLPIPITGSAGIRFLPWIIHCRKADKNKIRHSPKLEEKEGPYTTYKVVKSHVHTSSLSADSKSETEIQNSCLSEEECSHQHQGSNSMPQHLSGKTHKTSKKLHKTIKSHKHASHLPADSESETDITESCKDHKELRCRHCSRCKLPPPCSTHSSSRKTRKTLKSCIHTSELSGESQSEIEREESSEHFSHRHHCSTSFQPCSSQVICKQKHKVLKSRVSQLSGDSQSETEKEESHKEFSRRKHCSKHKSPSPPCSSRSISVQKHKTLKSHISQSSVESQSKTEMEETHEDFSCRKQHSMCKSSSPCSCHSVSKKIYSKLKSHKCTTDLLDDSQSKCKIEESHRTSQKQQHSTLSPRSSHGLSKKVCKSQKSHKHTSKLSSDSKSETEFEESHEEFTNVQHSSTCDSALCPHHGDSKKINKTLKFQKCPSKPAGSHSNTEIKECESDEEFSCGQANQKCKMFVSSHGKSKKFPKAKKMCRHTPHLPSDSQIETPVHNLPLRHHKNKSHLPSRQYHTETKNVHNTVKSHRFTSDSGEDLSVRSSCESREESVHKHYSSNSESPPSPDPSHTKSKKFYYSSSTSHKHKSPKSSPYSSMVSGKSCLKKFPKSRSHKTRSASRCSASCAIHSRSTSTSDMSLQDFHTDVKSLSKSQKQKITHHSYLCHSRHRSHSTLSPKSHKMHVCGAPGHLPECFDPNLGYVVPSNKSFETPSEEEVPVFVFSLSSPNSMQDYTLPTIMVFGGITLQEPWSQYIGKLIMRFHPLKNRWEFIDLMPVIRNYHSAALLDDRIYLIGGYDPTRPVGNGMAARRTVIAYDIHERRWIKRASLSQGRAFHGTAVIHNKLYIIGGRDNSGRILSSVEVYDPLKDDWQESSPLPCAVMGAAVICVEDDIWVIGGVAHKCNYFLSNEVYKYNTCMSSWSCGPTLKCPVGFSAALTVENTVWLCGGAILAKNKLDSSSDVWKLGPNSCRWEKCYSMKWPKHCSSGLAIESCLYLLGGICSQEMDATAKTDLILTESGEIHSLCPLPIPLTGMACIVLPPKAKKVYKAKTVVSLVKNFWPPDT